MASLFSTLATTAGQWSRPNPDHATITGTLGHAAASNRAQAATALVNAAAHSPTVVAFQLTSTGGRHHIHIGFHPTIFPADMHSASAFDNRVHVLGGNDIDTAMGNVLEPEAFMRDDSRQRSRSRHQVDEEGPRAPWLTSTK